MEQLKQLFSLNDCVDFEERFYEIAKALFTQYAIKTLNYGIFRFKEIEFYYYNSKHRDIITHPRNSEPLTWYINDFGGIDLNFASSIEREKNSPIAKYKLNDNSYFGGILIRQLTSDKINLDSPLKVSELFRSFDASGKATILPEIISNQWDDQPTIQKAPRKNLVKHLDDETIAAKVRNIRSSCYQECPDGLEKDFEMFCSKNYRFTI